MVDACWGAEVGHWSQQQQESAVKVELECVRADGLPLGGAQLAMDMTLVSPLHRDGRAIRGAAEKNGKALENARQRKERKGRFVVLGAEVGGPVVDNGVLDSISLGQGARPS